MGNAYKEGDCLLNSSSNTKWPICDADYYQMYFWQQGRFVECSDDHPEDTKAEEEEKPKTVNKSTQPRESTTTNRKSNKERNKEMVDDFENWLKKEANKWENLLKDDGGFRNLNKGWDRFKNNNSWDRFRNNNYYYGY